jgi:hypothetical protein
LEAEFALVTTEMKRQLRQQQLLERQQKRKSDPYYDGTPRITYGEQSLARSMSDILEHVTEKFSYTSLEELNIILRLYKMEADGGKEGTKLYHDRGLRYRALDDQGRHIGRPINASFFDCKPTLANLEKKFVLNQTDKEEHRRRVITWVKWGLYGEPDDLEAVKDSIRQDGIAMLLDRDKNGDCQGVAYVDFTYNTVYTAAQLGSECDHHAFQQVVDRQRIREAQESQNQSLEQSQRYYQGHGPRLSMW